MIIKRPFKREHNPLTFVCLADGSKYSLAGLHFMMQMRQPQDKIKVIICEQENVDTERISDRVNHDLEDKGCLGVSEVTILKA